MGILITPEQIALYQFYSRAIISDLGRPVILHLPGTDVGCPNCIVDPIGKKSTGMFRARVPYPTSIPGPTPFVGGICPICNGSGRYTTETIKTVDRGSIRWLKETQKRYLVQGLDAENDCKIKCDIKYLNDFKNSRKVVVDSIPLEVSTIIKRGLGELIFISVYLKLSQWNAGKPEDISKY